MSMKTKLVEAMSHYESILNDQNNYLDTCAKYGVKPDQKLMDSSFELMKELEKMMAMLLEAVLLEDMVEAENKRAMTAPLDPQKNLFH